MWVFCAGMQRAGSTLQYQITSHILEAKGIGQRIPWVPPDHFGDVHEKFRDCKDYKIFKTHTLTPVMRNEFINGNAIGVCIYRDLRDVYASILRRSHAAFDEKICYEVLEFCMKQLALWSSQPNTYVSKYEEVIENLPLEVANIAQHLGILLETNECESIAAQYSVERQKERMQKVIEGNDSIDIGHGRKQDSKSLLHSDHITATDDKSETWRRAFTDEQIASIEKKAGSWLMLHGYNLKFS